MSGFVDVAVPLGVRKTFAYSIPPALITRVSVGTRVLVPFGPKLLQAVVVARHDAPPPGDFRIRPIRDVLDQELVVPPALVQLALWIADYYFTAPGEVLRALLPTGSLAEGDREVRLSERARTLFAGGLRPVGLHPKQEQLMDVVSRAGRIRLQQLRRYEGMGNVQRWLEPLAADGWLEISSSLSRSRVREKMQLGIQALAADADTIASLSKPQRALYERLWAAAAELPLQAVLRSCGTGPSVARVLEKRGLVAIRQLRVDRIPLELSPTPARQPLTFTPAQSEVFARLCELVAAPGSARCLLYGVTGSGKTEIYLRLIGEVLHSGGTAILLVPEIGLTPMLSRIAQSHFPDQVALLHSGMSPGERFDQWNRIHLGRARVVVGTRSAVFAPLENLRLIVIDEEQDPSYKQDESPCYHARDVAWHRLQADGGTLLLGSATPSMETYCLAQEHSTMLQLTLPERIEARPMPEVMMVDMSLEFQRHGRKTVISGQMRAALAETLERGEQAIVLLNRRGYSRSLLCRSCGNVFSCPDCSIPMTYHQKERRLICHYCAMERGTPAACDSCGGEFIYFVGVGTEQLEEILRTEFPRARLARVDRDTMRRRGALHRTLFDFAAHKLDVLVGTQMLAKGHDFPGVTLVGVVSADAGLAFPDFRSAERTFQLLTQVAGRAGRGENPGRVVIQSFYPDHYALRFASRQDYGGFYHHEIEFRRLLGYPPFRRLVQILISSDNADKGLQLGAKIAEELQASADWHGVKSRLQVLGPAAAPLEKLRGQYRFQLLLKAAPAENLESVLHEAFAKLGRRKVSLRNVQIDVDPLSLL